MVRRWSPWVLAAPLVFQFDWDLWKGRSDVVDLLIQSHLTDFRDSSPVVSTKPTDLSLRPYRVW
jgi:hypothetical protein